MEVLVINGHDYSRHIERKGVGWSRNDLDSDKTTRTKDDSRGDALFNTACNPAYVRLSGGHAHH